MVSAIRHCGFWVWAEMHDECVKFYIELGLRISYRKIEDYISPFGKILVTKLKASDGNVLELVSPLESNFEGFLHGHEHVAFTVKDVVNLCWKLTKDGHTIDVPPTRSPDGKAIVAFVRDPDGILVELAEEL